MIENSPFSINEHSERRYMHGWINWLIRLYIYFQEGLGQTSNLKNIAYALIGIAGVFALNKEETPYIILGLIGVACVPILILVGFMWLTRGKKTSDYFIWKKTSPLGKYGTELAERQMQNSNRTVELLEEVLKELRHGQRL